MMTRDQFQVRANYTAHCWAATGCPLALWFGPELMLVMGPKEQGTTRFYVLDYQLVRHLDGDPEEALGSGILEVSAENGKVHIGAYYGKFGRQRSTIDISPTMWEALPETARMSLVAKEWRDHIQARFILKA